MDKLLVFLAVFFVAVVFCSGQEVTEDFVVLNETIPLTLSVKGENDTVTLISIDEGQVKVRPYQHSSAAASSAAAASGNNAAASSSSAASSRKKRGTATASSSSATTTDDKLGNTGGTTNNR